MKNTLVKFFSLLILVWPFSALQAQTLPKPKLVIQSGKVKNTFSIEIADDDLSREKGLMFRKSLDKNAGMLFIFKYESVQGFWMKNTLIPLDIIYIEKGGEIAKVAEAKALDQTIISSEVPIVAVLEIKGGEAKKRGIRAGNKVIYPLFAK